MREFLTVLAYTFRENIRKKTFIVSTIIVLILTTAIMIIPCMITNASKSSTPNNNDRQNNSALTQNFYVIDNMNVFNKSITPLKQTFSGYNFEIKPSSDVDSLISRVKKEDNTFLLVLDEKIGTPTFTYYVNKYGTGPNPDKLEPILKNLYASSLLKSAGVDISLATKILSIPSVTVNELGKGYIKSMILSMLIIFVLFFAIYFFGYGIAMSVASEKTSRVMETLITSTRPSRIIFGKTVAMGLLGLFQLALMLLTAVITYRLFFPKDFKLFGQSLDFSAFTPLVIIMIVIYFVLGYFLYAILNAVAGASVSKAEDVNTAIMPVSMISLIAFYISYFPTTIPNTGKITVITSMIPFTSPFSMPSRLLMANVSPLELFASIALLIATIVLLSWMSVKIYSVAILHYGKRLRLGDYIKMTKNK